MSPLSSPFHSLPANYLHHGGTRQGFPSARAKTARGLDRTHRDAKPLYWEEGMEGLGPDVYGDSSIEVSMGTFLMRYDKDTF